MSKHKPSPDFEKEVNLPEFPFQIDSISVQKKNKERFSIFSEDRFVIGISTATIMHFNLKKGTVIDFEKFEAIKSFEYRSNIKEYLLNLLGRRDHARNELMQKATQKGFPAEEIQDVLHELEEKGYINNQLFAKKFAKDKFRFNRWGTFRIQAELKRKGISDRDISLALRQFDEDELQQAIKSLVLKNRKKFRRTEPGNRKKKVFDFLLRKGYDSDIIMRVIPTLLHLIEE